MRSVEPSGIVLKKKPRVQEQVHAQLLELFAARDFRVGDRLVSGRSLAAQLNVNHLTVNKVLNRLAREDILERRPRSGTYLKRIPTRPKPPSVERQSLVSMLLWTQGHVYAELTRELSAALQRGGRMPLLSCVEDLRSLKTHVAECLDQALSSGCRHLVIDDNNLLDVRDETYRMVAALKDRLDRVVWIDLVGEHRPPGDLVCLDIQNAVRQVVEHLAERGHRRIGLVAHVRPDHIPPAMAFGGETFAAAFSSEMARAGLADSATVIGQPGVSDRDGEWTARLREALLRSDRPTALFAVQDSRAVLARDMALSLGLSVPRDLALVGFYDTPWAERYQLTSVSPEIRAVVREVARLLELPPEANAPQRVVRVRTKLVVRCSS